MAADFCRMILEMIGFAAYGPFSYPVASADRLRAGEVYQEIHAVRCSLAFALASALIATNEGLVGLWVGAGYFKQRTERT